MADLLVRSGGVSGGWTGTVYTTFAAAIAAPMAAGDRLIVSDAHSESTAAAVTLTFPGTAANPNQILVFTDAGGPLGTLSTGATVATTGASNIAINGVIYCRGVTFSAGSGASTASINQTSGTSNIVQTYENCSFILNNTSTSSLISYGAGRTNVAWINCSIKFGSTSQKLSNNTNLGVFRWLGGSAVSGTSTPSGLFNSACFALDGVDLSNFSSSLNIGSNNFGIIAGKMRNCKLPASWSGAAITGTANVGNRLELINCDSANTNYRCWIEDYAGTIKQSTSVYVTADTDDGTTPLSYVMATNANNKWPATYLRSQEFFLWNDGTGSAKNLQLEIAYDGATALTDRDMWVEYTYLGDSGSPLGTVASTICGPITSATNLTTSATAWTGASGTGPNGSTTWNTQKIVPSFTPNKKGPVIAVVCFALPSKSAYIDFPNALT